MPDKRVTDEQLAEWETLASRNQALGVPSARDERILALVRALRGAQAEIVQLREFAEWLASMGHPADKDGWRARHSVTLNDIIARARAALAAPIGQEDE